MQRWAPFADAIVVVAFVVVGREDHGFASDLSDYMRVAAPFLIGLAVASFAFRGRGALEAGTGLAVALGTVLVGMAARRWVWDDGTAFAFIVVTTAFLVAGMVGWRLVAARAQRLLTG